jgi:hypothetical protein
MGAYYKDDHVTLHLGDCLHVLPALADASVDAVATDPPYEIGIAGQAWDSTGIAYNVDLWRQCLRVLKPGGHLLSFGATKTYHRMVCAAEDAGFLVVDQLDWIYTNGKPKGTDLARSIDRRRDDRVDVLEVTAWLSKRVRETGWTVARMNDLFGFHVRGKATHWITQGVAAAIPTVQQWGVLRQAMGFDDTEIRRLLESLWARKGTAGEAFAEREIISERRESARDTSLYKGYSGVRIKSKAASEDARRWEGWNTALKPSHDPILLARRSAGFDTLTASVLKRGTGGLNVAACPSSGGGWPANIVLGHDCDGPCQPGCPVYEMGDAAPSFPVFRLQSKTPARERVEVDGVRHDTPKPLALMQWLVRLVCPPGGTILDPFGGSGTTGLAARAEGVNAVLVERHEPYARIAAARLAEPYMTDLFGGAA